MSEEMRKAVEAMQAGPLEIARKIFSELFAL